MWEKKAKAVRELLDKKCEVLDEYMKDEKDNLQNLFDTRSQFRKANLQMETKIKEDLEKLEEFNENLPTEAERLLQEDDLIELAMKMDKAKVQTFVKQKQFAEQQLWGISLSDDAFTLLLRAMDIEEHRKRQREVKTKLEQNDTEIEAKIEFIAQSKFVSELQGCKEEEK